jgi:hypothetical protein
MTTTERMMETRKFRIAALAASLLGAAALGVTAVPAIAQMHGGFHAGGMHGWRGGTWRGTWHGHTAWNRGWRGHGGFWRGGRWFPGWRGGVAVGFYGGWPYYDPYYGYDAYPYGYYGGAYNYCDDPNYPDDEYCGY